jgi:prolyl-tRNA synthetase
LKKILMSAILVGLLAACSTPVKEETKATVRCYPLDTPEGEGVCFYTGQRTSRIAIFARAY